MLAGQNGYFLATSQDFSTFPNKEDLASSGWAQERCGDHGCFQGVHLPVCDVDLSHILIAKLEFVDGIESDPMYKKLGMFIHNLAV